MNYNSPPTRPSPCNMRHIVAVADGFSVLFELVPKLEICLIKVDLEGSLNSLLPRERKLSAT